MNPSQPNHLDGTAPLAHDEIALRAHDKWVARDRPRGTELRDWLEAEAELRLVRDMAQQLAAIQEQLTRHIAEQKQAGRQRVAEHAVSRTLAASGTLEEAASKLLQAICVSLDWDVGELWLVDREANVLWCAAIWHRPEVEVPAFEQDTRQRTFSPGIGVPGRIWANETLAWIPDVAADTNLPRAAIAAKEGLHGAVGFPIRNGTEFFGVIGFFSQEIRHPDEQVVEMMASISSQISQFIERTQAEAQLHKQEEERRIARRIQQGLLPKAMPILSGFQIVGKSWTADSVGGDCFDFIPALVGGQESLGVLIADAAGHGIDSALLVGETRAYLRALALTCTDVGALLTLSNRRLAIDLGTTDFVTLLLVLLDPHTSHLRYAGAGHCPGYVLDRKGQTKAILHSTGMPLGIELASDFPEPAAIHLEPGNLVFLYTDGFQEARSSEEELFGLDRMLSVVRGHLDETPDTILESLFKAVTEFCGHHLDDDATAVIIKVEDVA